MRLSTVLAILAMLSFAVLLGSGCETDPGEFKVNQPPEVYLSSGPPNGDPNVNYKVHFYWNGYDPDGKVDHFEYLVTDDEVTGSIIIDDDVYDTIEGLGYTWNSIEVHDTIISVKADSIPSHDNPDDDIYFYGDDRFLFRAHHTFFLRAVDEAGAVSERPAYRTFTATTIAPAVGIDHPSDIGGVGGYDALPPDIFFAWSGRDSVGDGTIIEPDSTRFTLLKRGDHGLDTQTEGVMLELPEDIWLQWRHWDEVDSLDANISGKRALITGLTPISAGEGEGEYIFMVQAKDEAGAITSHFEDGVNLRKMRIVSSKQPLVVMREPVLGVRASTVDQTYDFTIAEDQPLSLTWTAFADDYGSEITGYRFGWDILDTTNEEEWSSWALSNTSAEASFVSGSHTFYLEARDYSGNSTRVVYRFFVVPFTMDRELLFIDDYDNTATFDPDQGWPAGPQYTWGTLPHDDSQQKAFWDGILTEYGNYDPVVDFFRVSSIKPIPPFETVAQYRRLIWEVKEYQPGTSGLARVARFVDIYAQDEVPFDYLSAFMDRGGQVVLCGVYPVFSMLPMPSEMGNPDYERKGPMAFLRHLNFSEAMDPGESIEAVQRFLPWAQFGIDAVVKPVDQTPKDYEWGGADFPNYRVFWGMDGMGYSGAELELFPNTTGWAPADTLRFRPEVYQWLDQAGDFFMDQTVASGDIDCSIFDCADPPHYYGLDVVEVYNWDFFATTFDPPLNYRENASIPLLTYVAADPTTRFGPNPTEDHPYLTTEFENFDELSFSTGGDAQHTIAMLGMANPEAPSVLIGTVPYYLHSEDAQGFLDHILIDIFGMSK